jgi:predicted AAA+ superfamily ATPase
LESALAPIIVVRGPRQIGKSTAQVQVIEDLLARGITPSHIFRVQFDELSAIASLGDEPILRMIDWYEKDFLHSSINAVARSGASVFLFLDEVQNLKDWHVQLKFLVDHTKLRVVVTGSSALRIERGRDSLAGRITTLEVGTLTLTEIAAFRSIPLGAPVLDDNGFDRLGREETWRDLRRIGRERSSERDRSFQAFAERGGYPIVHQHAAEDWAVLADQLNETVIKRVIEHDLRVGERGRKRDRKLLEELFRLACRYAGQAPNVTLLTREAQRVLAANVGSQRVHHYMKFLADTLLLRLIEPLEIRIKKKRGAPKICLADHGLRASWLEESIPLDPGTLRDRPELTTLAGHLAESVVGAALSTIPGLDLAWLPERGGEPEVDFVLTVGTMRIPLEVKYQRRIEPMRDTEGLRTFIEKTINRAPFGVLVTQVDDDSDHDPRIVSLPLSSLMLLR